MAEQDGTPLDTGTRLHRLSNHRGDELRDRMENTYQCPLYRRIIFPWAGCKKHNYRPQWHSDWPDDILGLRTLALGDDPTLGDPTAVAATLDQHFFEADNNIEHRTVTMVNLPAFEWGFGDVPQLYPEVE